MQTQKGWLYVLIGLLISSFLGGAIHVFFAPDRVRDFVDHLLKENQPKFAIKFETAELRLSTNGWPAVAIELGQIELQAKDSCMTGSFIQMDRILIPLQLTALLRKEVRFGHIQAGQVRFHHRPASRGVECQDRKLVEGSETELMRLERFFQKRWAREVVNTTRFLQMFSMQRFEMTRDDQSLPPLRFEEFTMEFDSKKKESRIETFVQLDQPLIGEAEFGRLMLKAVVRAEEAQVAYSGNLKEGQFDGEFRWAIDRGEIATSVTTRDLPLKSIFQLAHHYGYFQQLKSDFKNEWLSCDVTLSGLVAQSDKWMWNLHQCRMYGDLGEMHILSQQLKFKPPFSEIKISMQDVSVKRWLQSFGWAENWGRISEFGRFQGELKIASTSQLEMKGDWRGLEIYLASLEHRVRQRIENVNLALAVDGDRFSGRAENIRLNDGEAEGFLTFNVSFGGDGLIQMALPKVMMSVDSQKALWSGRAPAFGLFGKAELVAGDWVRFSGDLALKEWQTMNWEIFDLKSTLAMEQDVWTLGVKAESFIPRPESKWLPFLNGITTQLKNGDPSRPKDLIFGNLNTQIVLDPSLEGRWSALTAGLKQSNLRLESHGSWTAKEGLSGRVTTKAGASAQTVQVGGTWFTPRIVAD